MATRAARGAPQRSEEDGQTAQAEERAEGGREDGERPHHPRPGRCEQRAGDRARVSSPSTHTGRKLAGPVTQQRLPMVGVKPRGGGRLAELREDVGEAPRIGVVRHVPGAREDFVAAAGHRLVGGEAVM